MSREEIWREYGSAIKEESVLDEALADDMGDHIFLACFPTMKEVETFFDRVLEEK